LKIVTLNIGTKYQGYTEKLYSALKRNTTHDFSFECITEQRFPDPCWDKMQMFAEPNINDTDYFAQTVYIDVDTVITGNVDFLFEYTGRFAIVRNWYTGRYAGGLMSIGRRFDARGLYEKFIGNARCIAAHYLDQDWLYEIYPNADFFQDLAPGKIKSFKADNVAAQGPGDASIVMFHGQTLPHHLTQQEWVVEHWR
jgi:hypothetical protein